jgi:hypothetical protein
MKIPKDATLRSETIQVRGLKPLGPENTNISVALVICEDNHDIGEVLRSRLGAHPAQNDEQTKQGNQLGRPWLEAQEHGRKIGVRLESAQERKRRPQMNTVRHRSEPKPQEPLCLVVHADCASWLRLCHAGFIYGFGNKKSFVLPARNFTLVAA